MLGNCRSQAAAFSSTPHICSNIGLYPINSIRWLSCWSELIGVPHDLCHVYLPTNTISSPVSSRLCWQRRWVFFSEQRFQHLGSQHSWQWLQALNWLCSMFIKPFLTAVGCTGGSRWHSNTVPDDLLLLLLVRKSFEHPSLQVCDDPQIYNI